MKYEGRDSMDSVTLGLARRILELNEGSVIPPTDEQTDEFFAEHDDDIKAATREIAALAVLLAEQVVGDTKPALVAVG